MDKKKTIETIIVVCAFLGSGIILYKNFVGSSGSGPSLVPLITSTTSSTPTAILPYGQTFDYKKIDDLEKQGFEFGQINYPVVSTSTEVGKTPDQLIAPLPAVGTTK